MLTKMTSRAGLLVAAISIALIAASGVALAAVINCTANTTCVGTFNNDALLGTLGEDRMYGQGGNDQLFGQHGKDELTGGPGADHTSGDFGNDRYYFAGNWGHDQIADSSASEPGPGGFDGLHFENEPQSLIIRLDATNDYEVKKASQSPSYRDTVNFLVFERTGTNIELVVGGLAGDTIRGTYARGDYLYGNSGSDVLYGLGSQDGLVGQQGRDTIYPGVGRDLVTGDADDDTIIADDGEVDDIYCGPGSDYVVYDANVDRISDCERTHPR